MSSFSGKLPEMEYRFLGRSGLKVSLISLGNWLTYVGPADRDRTFACMKAAYDVGCNFFDCAENRANGDGERIMGEAIKKFGWKRNDLVISTKIYWGNAFGNKSVNNVGLSRKHILEGLDMSLDRLQLSYVDLVYAQKPDRQTPMEEIVRAFNHVIAHGKAMYWGTSSWAADEIAQAWRCADKLGLIGPLMEQPEYNLMKRFKVESEFVHLYRDVGLGVTVFSPLRQGLLTGKYQGGIPPDSRLAQTQIEHVARIWRRQGKEQIEQGAAQVKLLEPIAEKLGVSQAVLALAWVLKNPNVSSAITGASKPEQIYENVKAIETYKKLTPDVMDEIDAILNNKPPTMTERF